MHGRSLDGCLTGLVQGACRVNSGNQWRGRLARAIPPHKYQYEEGDRVMYVAIFFQDLPGTAAKRQAVVSEHRKYIEAHASQVLAAGAPFPDDGKTGRGGSYGFPVASPQEARDFVAKDHFTQAGDRASCPRQPLDQTLFHGEI